MHFTRNTFPPYEYELTCFLCGYNVLKRKNELKISRKKISLINRSNFAQHKIYCICIAVYKNYEGEDFSEIFSFLSKLKNKLKIKNELIEKHKNMRRFRTKFLFQFCCRYLENWTC